MNYKDELINEQEEHLDEIIHVADSIKNRTRNINKELTKQEGQIQQLDEEMDSTAKKMNFVQKKLGELLKTNDPSQLCTILILFAIVMVLIFLVIYT